LHLRTGLNPYGLTHHLGLHSGPRQNPHGKGLEGFLELATELGSRSIEIREPWLIDKSPAEIAALRARIEAAGMTPVVSGGMKCEDFEASTRLVKALGAKVIRLIMTNTLCGDRNARGAEWPALISAAHERLAVYAPIAEREGIVIGIENHQDVTSAEMVALCKKYGPALRLVFDTGNAFAVGESPLDFAETIAPYVAHVHLKDYRVQFVDDGFRLVRCAIGDGAVPFRDIFALLGKHHEALTASLEPAALDNRHVRLLTPQWWRGYAPRDAESLARCLAAARVNRLPDDADHRTPWE
jgi:sugar phosphate isomerase/epimerase